jgi:hypothetical protein
MSVMPPFATDLRTSREVRKVPNPEMADAVRTKEKAARRRLLNSMIVDQAAINAGFDLRRYAIKLMPAKPRIIIAQVEGSGTAAVFSK